MYRAAKMELLVADSINHPSMIIEKLQAYQRATEYFTNQQYSEIDFEGSYDVYSGLLQLCPYLCKFLVRTLSDPFEPIKLAGIKGLEFLIEYLGCTLGNFLPQILIGIFKTYPSINDIGVDQTQNQSFIDSQIGSDSTIAVQGVNNSKTLKQIADSNRNRSHAFIEGIGSQQLQHDQKNQTHNELYTNLQKSQYFINFKMVIDMYHHLLESFLNVLASASSQILRVIFNDVIVNNLFKPEVNPELKIYCIRIAEKILAICQGDIEVSPNVLNEMILLLEELNSKPNGHVNLKFHVNKLWESIKLKYIYNMGSSQMNKLIEWVGDSLISQSENENLQSFQFLFHLLDISSVICYKLNGPNAYKRNNLINSCRNQKDINQTSPNQNKNNTVSSSNTSTNGQIQNTQKTNSSLLQTSQNYNQSLEYDSTNLKNQQCALVVNQNELINVQYLLKPLMLWIENSLQHQTKFELFRSIWFVLIEVLICINNTSQQNLFQKNENDQQYKNEIRSSENITIADISLPLLQKINIYIQSQQPNEKMLQFLIIITNSLLQFPQESSSILLFFLEFFQSYIQCIPHSIHDETFIIFDNLCDIITPKNFTPYLIEVNNLTFQKYLNTQYQSRLKEVIDFFKYKYNQYTVKGKAHRKSKDKFIQIILKTKQNLHQALQKLLFENKEQKIISKKKKDTKICSQMQELFSEKLSLVSEIFSQLNKENFSVIEELISSNRLQKPFLDLINSRNSKSRLKGLNILKVLFEQYLEIYEYSVKPIQKLNRQDAYFIKLMLICLKRGLENERDSKLQFNALLVLDQFLQNLFKGPNLEQEILLSQNSSNQPLKNQQNISQRIQSAPLDLIENFVSKEHPEVYFRIQISQLENIQYIQIAFDSTEYLQFRSEEILKLWPIISMLIDSPWSNIRSIAYGIICYWVKDASGLKDKQFMNNLINTLQNLLISNESECRTGGLNILGSLCGLGFNFNQNSNELKNSKEFSNFFRRNSSVIPNQIWEIVYDMQFDWDQTNQAASVILIQLSAPKECVKNIIKSKQGGLTFKINNRDFPNMNDNNKHKQNFENTQNMAQFWKNLRLSDRIQYSSNYQIEDFLKDEYVFWMPMLENEEIMELISMFKNEFKPPQTLWIERVNYNMEESKQEELEQNYSWIDEKQTFDGYKQFGLDKEEEILDFEDLGIIEIDDEEWNEYDVVDSDNSRRKIPNLKQKINNISPQLQIRDKSPSTRVLRKGKLQQQQNFTKDTGIDNFSQRVTSQNMDNEFKQQQKSPEKINGAQSSNNQVIEEESGEESSNYDEYSDQMNVPYQEIEQYLQIDDGENVRIIDELELMQFLKQHQLALQRPNGIVIGANDEKQKRKAQGLQTVSSSSLSQQNLQQIGKTNQQTGYSSSSSLSGSQTQINNDKFDKYEKFDNKYRPLTPPVYKDEIHQNGSIEGYDGQYGGSSLQQHLINKAQQQGNNQLNILNFQKNSLLSQQKSEDYIYSDSAESDDYQDMFIKQQEFLFRQQKQQKSQLNNNRDIPNRPHSARLKKEESISNVGGGSFNNFQGLGQSVYHYEMIPHQSSSLPSIAQVATGSKSSSQSLFKNKNSGNKSQTAQPSATSCKQTKQQVNAQAVAHLNQNYSGKLENIRNQQSNDESSDDEHLNLLQSRYSSSKQTASNKIDGNQAVENKQNLSNQKETQKNNKSNKQNQKQQQKQIRYFSPPRPLQNAINLRGDNFGIDTGYESQNNPGFQSDLLSSPFDQNTDIMNLDSPARNSISPQQQIDKPNALSNYAQYQQLQFEQNQQNGQKSSSDLKKKSKENSNSMMATLGQYSNEKNQQQASQTNNNSLGKTVLQNNYMSGGNEYEENNKQININQSDLSKPEINQNNFNQGVIFQSSPSANNDSNTNYINNLNNYVPVGSNTNLSQQPNNTVTHQNFSNPNLLGGNYMQAKPSNSKNHIQSNGNLQGGVSSFEENVDLLLSQKLLPYQQQQLLYSQSTQNSQQTQHTQQTIGSLQPSNQQNPLHQQQHMLQILSQPTRSTEQTQNSLLAAQGSYSYLQNLPSSTNSQIGQTQHNLNIITQGGLIQQITNGNSTTNNPKFISDKVNINRLVSVPSNYKSHFGTNQSLSGIYQGNHHLLIQNQTNSSNSNYIFNSTLNGTLANAQNISNSQNQNQTLQQQNMNNSNNNTLVSHRSTGNLLKNAALNNSNQTQSSISGNNYSNTLSSKSNPNQLAQSSRSKEKLLKKLMVKNIDFDDLKSVWKMSSEIKNISGNHNLSNYQNNAHHNQSSNSSHHQTTQQTVSNQHNQQLQQNHPIYYYPNQQVFIEDYQSFKDQDAVQEIQNPQINQQFKNDISCNQNTNNDPTAAAKISRSNSLGKTSKGVIGSSLISAVPAVQNSSGTKLKKDTKKKKNKKKIDKNYTNSNSKSSNLNQQHHTIIPQILPFTGTTLSQQNTSRNHHLPERKLTSGSNLNSDRSASNPENNLTFKKMQIYNQISEKNSQQIVASPQKKSLQQSPNQKEKASSIEKKRKQQSKNSIPLVSLLSQQYTQKDPQQQQGLRVSIQQGQAINQNEENKQPISFQNIGEPIENQQNFNNQ